MKSNQIFRLLFVIMLLTQASACAITKPVFQGQVVDAETKEPIEGAVVVAIYKKQSMGLGAGANTEITGVRETLTNRTGNFHIGSHVIFLIPVWNRESATTFIVFKPGYASIEGLDLEDILSKDTDTTGKESPWLYNQNLKFVFSHRLIGLPKVKTREDRWHASTVGVADYSEKELPLLYKARNAEDKALGIK